MMKMNKKSKMFGDGKLPLYEPDNTKIVNLIETYNLDYVDIIDHKFINYTSTSFACSL